MVTSGVDQGSDRARLHQRGSTAAEEDRGEPAAGEQAPFVGEVGEQGVAPFVLVDCRTDMAVEVAIGALADAERPVDVEGESFAHHFRAATSFSKARARWLILCFSAGSISPNVRSWPAGTNIGS